MERPPARSMGPARSDYVNKAWNSPNRNFFTSNGLRDDSKLDSMELGIYIRTYIILI